MSAHAYTEDQLLVQPAIGLFLEHGWTTVSELEETFGARCCCRVCSGQVAVEKVSILEN